MPERAPTVPRRPPVLRPAPAPAPGPTRRRPRAPAGLLHPMSPPGAGVGSPLPGNVAGPISASFGVDVSPVRLHSDAAAVAASHALGARAFAVGSHIFLGDGERPTDMPLIAHEVAHVVQQQGAPRVQLWTTPHTGGFEREAHGAAAAVVRRERFTVRERTRPGVQRLGISDALDYFADKANLIPGFRMFTIVLGVNPINQSRVERTPANIMRAVVEFLPGGGLITQALDKYGVFDKVAAWAQQQIATLGLAGASIKAALDQFLGTLGLRDIFDLGGVWERAKQIFTVPIQQIKDFAAGLVDGIVRFVKDAILTPLAKLAEGTRGWDLLTAVLGKNPITGEPVARNADTLIGGFLKLINQQEVYENMKKSGAIGRAWAWFQGAMNALIGFVSQIPTLAVNAFKALQISDILDLPGAFSKVGAVFGDFIGNFIDWAGKALWDLLEIIFDVVSPKALEYIKRTGAALKSILKNPLPFLGNLINAAKQGFLNFGANFLEHLKSGLIDWLTGSLPGVYIPKAFELGEIVKFVFSVLGISWQNVRQKLVKVIGETAMSLLEKGFDVVVTLVRDGPAAAWDKIKDELSNLEDMVIGGITDFVVDTVVKKAIPQLLSLFIPGAGFITAIIKIYDTIMVFVSKLSKIVAVVTAFIDSIVRIAAGDIAAAAKKVESVLASLLSLAINFLAGFAGLGKVADKILGVIKKVQTAVDKALDKLVAWIVAAAKKVKGFFTGDPRTKATPPSTSPALGEITVQQPVSMAGAGHQLTFQIVGGRPQVVMASGRLGVLDVLVTSALYKEEHGARRAPLIAELTQIRAKLHDLGEDWAAATSKSDADKRSAIAQWLGALAGLLQQIGSEYKIPDLEHLGHPSKYVEGNLIKPEYQAEIRTRFYPNSYRAATLSWFDARLRQLENPVMRTQFRDEMTNEWEPKSTATIDHKERVVEQWNATGSNERQPDRGDYYNDTGKLRIVALRNNSGDGAMARKAGLRYRPNVGPNFRGPDDNL